MVLISSCLFSIIPYGFGLCLMQVHTGYKLKVQHIPNCRCGSPILGCVHRTDALPIPDQIIQDPTLEANFSEILRIIV
jgi:hypothetical protein